MLPAEFYNIEVQVIPVWGLYQPHYPACLAGCESYCHLLPSKCHCSCRVQTGLKLLSNSDAKRKGAGSCGAPNAKLAGISKIKWDRRGVDLTDTSKLQV